MGIGRKNKVAPEDEEELTEKNKFGKPKNMKNENDIV